MAFDPTDRGGIESTDECPSMNSFRIALVLALLGVLLIAPGAPSQDRESPSAAGSPPSQQSSAGPPVPALPRGKKLILKDGSFQLVREYQIQGDRIRYYSIDSADWEEMPASLVDWDATKKADTDDAHRMDAAIAQAKKREELRSAVPLDIDASLEVAPGIFLPPGDGPFAFDGKAIFALAQADMNSTVDRKKAIERVLVPIPVVPSRHTVTVAGTRAKLRLRYAQPEFYMRTSDGTEPKIEIVRAKVHGYVREIVKVDELFGEQAATADQQAAQRWVIAPGVFRFTVARPLEPGEYAMVETSNAGGAMNLYIWDFGVEKSTAAPPPNLK
jgi:hypothetical protein